jgi:hypothetical protein
MTFTTGGPMRGPAWGTWGPCVTGGLRRTPEPRSPGLMLPQRGIATGAGRPRTWPRFCTPNPQRLGRTE